MVLVAKREDSERDEISRMAQWPDWNHRSR